ncbi:hypothetical protein F5Y15DRAFT_46836 [Xylariaceae sp. FL0016]|nr:hypothetical protein F5Y15DRAFT_46836 [Xylariaceae sp. FL0016]
MSLFAPLIDRSSPSGTFTGSPPAHLPAENGVHVWRAAVSVPIVTGAFVAARLYTKAYMIKKRFTVDDYIVVVTLLVCVAHAVLMANAAYNGMGLHIWQYDDDLNARYYLWIGITSEFYVLGLMGFKVALLLLYLQLFGVNTKFRWACYGTLFFSVAYLLCNLFTEFLGCTPIEKKWYPSTPGSCIDSKITNAFYGACSMATDLVIAILPLTMVWRLVLPSRRQKVGLTLILSCGFVTWAVAVARWGIAVYNMFTYDRPWWAGISFTLSILEINTGLICACISTLGPLWQLAYVEIRDWTSRRSSEVSIWPPSLHKKSVSEKRSRPSDAAMHPRPMMGNGTLITAGGTHQPRPDNAVNPNYQEDEFGLLDMAGRHVTDTSSNSFDRTLNV